MKSMNYHEFKPDWCLPPGELLRAWLEENHFPLPALAAACTDRWRRRGHSARLIREVLDRKPLTIRHAMRLARGTGVPATLWLAMEDNYRVGLAAGLTDASDM